MTDTVKESSETTEAPAPAVESSASEPASPAVETVAVAAATETTAIAATPAEITPSAPVEATIVKSAPVALASRKLASPEKRRWTWTIESGLVAASLAIAAGRGWLLGANTFETSAGSRQLAESITALDAKIERFAARANTGDDVADLRAAVTRLQARYEATQGARADALAQTGARIERLEHDLAERLDRQAKDQTARLDRFAERLERVERAAGAGDSTASIQKQIAPPPVTPPPVALGLRGGETRAPAASATGYVLREVRDGSALVEGRVGLREVVPGDTLPGVGRIRSMERRRGQWVVVTSNGVIEGGTY